MGVFYTNVTLIGVEPDRVRAAIDEPAFLAAGDGAVVVFAESDEDDTHQGTGSRLSAKLHCIAITVTVADDDLLGFLIHDNGRQVAAGVAPDPAQVFGPDFSSFAEVPDDLADGTVPLALDPDDVVELLDRGDVDQLRAALSGQFEFATERHRQLAAALELPTFAAGWGFTYLHRNAADLTGPELIRIGD